MTVYVGPEKYPFHFHKGRLCEESIFFEKAFNGSFQEAITESIRLVDESVEEIKIFEEWLYTSRVNYDKESDDPSLLLVKVYIVADKLGTSGFQNAVLHTLRGRAYGIGMECEIAYTNDEVVVPDHPCFPPLPALSVMPMKTPPNPRLFGSC